VSILATLRRALAFARTYDEAFHVLNGMGDRELARWGIARAEVWRVADRVAREAAGRLAPLPPSRR
jgi:uncharacterized protein YjiS (DUF1127 family)